MDFNTLSIKSMDFDTLSIKSMDFDTLSPLRVWILAKMVPA